MTLLTTTYHLDKKYLHDLTERGVQVVLFDYICSRALFIYSPSMYDWLKERITEFDIAHLHTYRSYQSIVASKVAVRMGVPYVLHAHGCIPYNNRLTTLKRLYDKMFGARVIRDACALFAISRMEVGQYQNLGATISRVKLVYNGIPSDSFENPPPLGTFKKMKSLTKDYILYLGRIDAAKGLDLLTRSYSLLVSTINDPPLLLIVGPAGDYLGELKRDVRSLGITEMVRIIPWGVYGKEKMAAYQDASLFVTPAHHPSGALLTALEAMICGTPTIVTEEVAEIHRLANIGYVLERKDPEILMEKMRWILENKEEARMMADRGRQYILANLSWSTTVDKIENVYKECTRKVY